jgi:hypothetical protein
MRHSLVQPQARHNGHHIIGFNVVSEANLSDPFLVQLNVFLRLGR